MSALLHIKNLLIAHLDPKTPIELKSAMMGVLNSIDSDLDEYGYVTTDETDEAIEELDRVLVGEDETESEETVGDIVMERPRVKVPDDDTDES